MPTVPTGPFSPQEDASSGRLDSWKQIAAYLGKGERTAKRWERERALPVHRLPGGGRGSVYAYAVELDEWLTSASDELEDGESNSPLEADDEPGIAEAATSPEREIPMISPRPFAPPAGEEGQVRTRRIPAYLLLAACLALAAIGIANFRTIGAHASLLLRPAARPVAGPVRAPSEADKEAARELYLRGRYEWNKRTPDSLNRALDDFTQAVVRDPGNAQIFVGLADTYDMLGEYSLMPDTEAYSRALAASKKAVELDDTLAEAHRSLAFAEVWGNWDFQAGEREFRRAIELNPRDPVAHRWFANAFAAPGWYPMSLRELNRAQELDPTSPVTLADKGITLFDAGQTREGLELLQQVERTDPEFISPHRYLAGAYLTLRDYPNFLKESEKTAQLTRDPVLEETNTAAREGFRKGGERGLLENTYAVEKKLHAEGKIAGVALAQMCVRLGKKAEALQLLREDYQQHRTELLTFRSDPMLGALKDEPEYKKLISDLHEPAPETAAAAATGRDALMAALTGK